MWPIEIYNYDTEDHFELLSPFKDEYGDVDPSKYDYFEWFCLKNPNGKAVIQIAREPESGRIIGQNWLIPLKVRALDNDYMCDIWVNALIDPAFRRKGIMSSIVNSFGKILTPSGLDFITGFPNNKSIKTAKAINLHKIGMQDLMILPLNWSFLQDTALGKFPLLHKPLSKFANLVWPLIKHEKKPKNGDSNISIEEVFTFDERFNSFCIRVMGKYPIMYYRDEKFLNWRFSEHPSRKYKILAATIENQIIGYLVYRVTNFRGFDSGFILDYLFEDSQRGQDSGNALIKAAKQDLREKQINIMVAMARPIFQEGQILKQNGFFTLPKKLQPIKLLFHRVDLSKNLNKSELDKLDNWFLQMGEYDYF